MNSTITKMDSNLTSMWVSFFTAAGIPSDVSATYALTFAENRIQNDMLLDLNKEYLRDMGISRMGDVIAILRHAKQVHENAARDRVLSTTSSTNKVPVAAVAGRSTVTQPSSPASRILEHYTRNAQTKETSPVQLQKRKSNESVSNGDSTIKKARLIRFGTPPPTATVKEDAYSSLELHSVKKLAYDLGKIQTEALQKSIRTAALSSKQTVFARLGNTEPVVAVASVTAVTAVQSQVKPEARPIFARLGSKSKDDPVIPMQKDALKYEGILKGVPMVKKTVTVTTTKNNVRKIACTMRADEVPVPVKEKLALPKNSATKSVKFSNTVQYKEIESNKKLVNIKPKFTTVFNKPERRLSMPESSVKERLGLKKPNNLTITRNVFNRLGV